MSVRFLLAVVFLCVAEVVGFALGEYALAQQAAGWTIIAGWLACWLWDRRRRSTATSSRGT